MSEDAFRIVVAAAVAVAALAFIVHYCIVIALYRDVKKIQKRVAQFAGEVKPVLASVGPIMEHVNPMIHRIGLVIEQFAPALEKSRPAIQRTRLMIGKVGQLVDEVGLVLAAADRIIQETRPRITEITMETVAIGKSGREQWERLGDLLHDVKEGARSRLKQIDETVESTVHQVGQVGDIVKRAMMKVVHMANGFAVGISAAFSRLVRGSRDSSVDCATQDEEKMPKPLRHEHSAHYRSV